MKIIARGAEAILYLENNKLVKERICKGYRIKQIDDKIRKFRTRSEAKLLTKASIANVPKLYEVDDKTSKLVMEYIDGRLVKEVIDNLEENELKRLCIGIGEQIGKLHSLGIVHGDLTTSNMIIKNNKIYLIDFGLGFISDRIEDKAVDLRLLRQALESKHYKIGGKAFSYVIDGYRKEAKYSGEVLTRLKEKVEKRGRYKRKLNRGIAKSI